MRVMTNPRPNKLNIRTNAVTVNSQSLSQLFDFNKETKLTTYQTDDEFLKGKFVCFAPTHHSAVIMGSTIQRSINVKSNRTVLDASKIVYRLNDDEIRTDIEMVLVNGQETSARWNHYALYHTCDMLVGDERLDVRLPDDLITMTNGVSGTANAYYADNSIKFTLTAAKLSSKNKDNIKALSVNVGDNVLLVLDGTTGRIKHILNPTQYELVNGKHEPVYLQSLTHKTNPLLYIDRQEYLLKPNDIVILGSAGFVDTLAGNNKTYNFTTQLTVSVEGDELAKAAPRNQISLNRKEIDIEQLNLRLEKIFNDLHQHYPVQPPAFAIADALIKDATHITLTDRQEKLNFAYWLHSYIQQYIKANCKEALQQYEVAIKRILEAYARECIETDYVKLKGALYTFYCIFFEATVEHTPQWEQFVQLITEKIKQGISRDIGGKDKERVAEEKELIEKTENNFTPEELFQLIVDTLKSILLKNNLQQNDVEQMIGLVVNIFSDEIIEYARELSHKSISATDIANYSHTFHSKLAGLKLDPTNDDTLEKFLIDFKSSWSQHLSLWVNGEKQSILSDRLRGKLFTRQDWFLSHYIKYLENKYYNQINELPKLKDTIAQFMSWCEIDISSSREQLQRAQDKLKERVKDESLRVHELESVANYCDKSMSFNQSYLSKLKNYLTTRNIDPNSSLQQLEEHFPRSIVTYGDDTTVSVAYALDPALEIMRAMIYYCRADAYKYGFGEVYKEKREMYWDKLCHCYPNNKITPEIILQLITKLRAEKHVGRADLDYKICSRGQKLEDLKSHIVYSYTENEIIALEQFCSMKTTLQQAVTLISNVTGNVADKARAHLNLTAILFNPNLKALEMCSLYNELTKAQFIKLNQHRNSFIDNLFGITITRGWSETLKSIRNDALTKLMHEVDDVLKHNGEKTSTDDHIKALALLQNALNQPLFNIHRNNSIFTGAYGDTLAVKAIRQRIVVVTNALSTLQNSHGEGIELRPLSSMSK